MITEKLIKKVLRKWLKKNLYINAPISTNIARFEWVYNSHLKEWRDRMWVIKNCPENRDKCVYPDFSIWGNTAHYKAVQEKSP